MKNESSPSVCVFHSDRERICLLEEKGLFFYGL